jgi:hypothetical protein
VQRCWIVNLQDLLDYRTDLVSEHEEELAAIDRLINRERNKAGSAHALNGTTAHRSVKRRRKKRGFPLATVSPAITKALQQLGNGNFTKDTVIAYLNQKKIPMEGWGPRAVGVNLWRRAKTGEIVVVEEGKGGSPVVYRKG